MTPIPEHRKGLPWSGLASVGMGLSILLLLLVGVGWAAGQANPGLPSSAVGELLHPQGAVEIRLSNDASWTVARTNAFLPAGAGVRTGPASRALVRLSNDSVVRLDERSTLQLRSPPPRARVGVVELLRGALYFFHRDQPTDTRFRTPLVAGAIRGTEFHLAVAEDGRTELNLIDGAVELTNVLGILVLGRGDRAVIEPNTAPRRTSILEATNVIQWCLYYPGIASLTEIHFAAESRATLAASIAAYRAGDLPEALAAYPPERQPARAAERLYLAALLLSGGQVGRAGQLAAAVSVSSLPGQPEFTLAESLRALIATVTATSHAVPVDPASPSSLLAESYRQQARSNLPEALESARAALAIDPEFGFAWARVAELEFSLGRIAAATRAMERALALSPRNAQAVALSGFLRAANLEFAAAEAQFDQAIALDSALGNAWLGRGLCRIRQGRTEAGRDDLLVAAALEPGRALLRSYLGKAFAATGDDTLAMRELEMARQLDANDPTAWFYAALLHQQHNRINQAMRELEQAQERNDHRAVFRSRLLLDQDQAVRGANLAAIYRDAGLFDTGLREAARAVQTDYANHSAHLLLAESYHALRDPARVHLRYETVAFSELLLANLLSPAAAGALSQSISHQEYTPLFERDRFGVSSSTEYRSSGDWDQQASQYGVSGRMSYSIDGGYRSQNGSRPNNDFRQFNLGTTLKVQVTPRDTALLQASYADTESGDARQYYAPAEASRSLRIRELQEPIAFFGWHRAWSPGVRTLALAGRLQDEFRARDEGVFIPTILRDSTGPVEVVLPAASRFRIGHQSELVAYTTEVQQIVQSAAHTVIGGLRYQDGNHETTSVPVHTDSGLFTYPAGGQTVNTDLRRFSVYAYDYWEMAPRIWLTPGVSYDHLEFPANIDLAPVSRVQADREQWSPKAALTWAPTDRFTVRGAYTRSLGGLYYDNSIRLEPTQMAGFNQAYRSLAPESVAGIAAGASFQTWGAGLDWRNGSGTYLGIEGELLESSAQRETGVYEVDFDVDPNRAFVASTPESMHFRERSLLLNANQLVSEEWSLGLRYRLRSAELDSRYPELDGFPVVATFPRARRETSATLQQLQLFVRFNHASGFFGEWQALWAEQSDVTLRYPGIGASQRLEGEDFWQLNVLAGWRLAQRRIEILLGVLNLTDTDYRLHPVTLHAELPRERTLVTRLRFNF